VFILGHDHYSGPDPLQEALRFTGTRAIAKLRHHGVAVTQVGDGASSIDFDQVSQAVAKQPTGALVISLIHGNAVAGEHFLIQKSGEMPSSRLFQAIMANPDPLDTLFLSCGSGIVHPAASRHLRLGSRLVTVAAGGDRLMAGVVRATLLERGLPQSLADGGVSFDKLLVKSLPAMSDENPAITVGGEGTCVLSDMLATRIGKGFSLSEMARIEANRWELDNVGTLRLCRAIRDGSPEVMPRGNLHGFALGAVLAASNRTIPLSGSQQPVL
jgi:hypothetical protein